MIVSVSLLHRPNTDTLQRWRHAGISENAAQKFQIFDISIAVASNPHLQSKKKKTSIPKIQGYNS